MISHMNILKIHKYFSILITIRMQNYIFSLKIRDSKNCKAIIDVAKHDVGFVNKLCVANIVFGALRSQQVCQPTSPPNSKPANYESTPGPVLHQYLDFVNNVRGRRGLHKSKCCSAAAGESKRRKNLNPKRA